MSHVHETSSQTSCVGAAPPAADDGIPEGEEGSPKIPMAGENSEETLEKTAKGIPARVYNMYVLRGLNEGFADFYGWLYSGDDTFLSKSLPDQDRMRRLDSAPGRLPSENLVRRLLVDNFHPDRILPESTRAHNAYSLGSIYARYLRRVVGDLVEAGHSLPEARELVGRALIATLPELGAQMDSIDETAYLSPNFAVSRLLAHLPLRTLTRETCVSLEDVRAPEVSFKKPASCDVFAVPEKSSADAATALKDAHDKKKEKQK